MGIENCGEDTPTRQHTGEESLGTTATNSVVEVIWGDPALLAQPGFQQASLGTREDWKVAKSIAARDVPMPRLMPGQLWDMIESARKAN